MAQHDSSYDAEEAIEEGSEEVQHRAYRKDILSALNSVERPGSFVVNGTLQSYTPPGLVIPDLGLVSLPLMPLQAEAIAKLCSQAPFGRK
jgi:hypothetical protein